MDLFKPCMICKKSMAVASCQKCGILLCNQHTKGGYCFACAATIKKEAWEQHENTNQKE